MSTTINNNTVSITGIQWYVSHGYSILSVDRYCSVNHTASILKLTFAFILTGLLSHLGSNICKTQDQSHSRVKIMTRVKIIFIIVFSPKFLFLLAFINWWYTYIYIYIYIYIFSCIEAALHKNDQFGAALEPVAVFRCHACTLELVIIATSV